MNDEAGDGGVGIRVTPNVYTTLDEIDRFVEAMTAILARPVPPA